MIYASLALKTFESDKVAYVFDSTLSHSKSTASQIRSEFKFAVEKVQFYLRGFDGRNFQLHPYNKINIRSDRGLAWLATYHPQESGPYTKRSEISGNIAAAVLNEIQGHTQEMVDETLQQKLSVRALTTSGVGWLLGFRFSVGSGKDNAVALAYFREGSFIEPFRASKNQDTYLVSKTGRILVRPEKQTYPLDDKIILAGIGSIQEKLKSPFGILEHPYGEDKALLISAARVGFGDLQVVSLVTKEAALEAVRLLMFRSLLFLGFLIFVTIFVSVLSSNQLTSSLKNLFLATKKISQGEFDVEIDVRSKDEIGGLADGFNKMAKEISRLVAETAEKARMQSELQTAQLVQSTLFPPVVGDFPQVEIRGYYEPASECGGDWWFYSQIGTKTYLWIGDATGHGVPAALVTSAARSAANVLEEFPDLSPSEVMSMMNRAIYGTSKGQVLMTFFFGIFDEQSKTLTYCNASHDPPYVVPFKGEEKIKKKDLLPLMDVTGKRLGEAPDSKYEQATVELNPGDRIVFYTDGVTELHNAEGDMWGEREFVKTIIKAYNEDPGLETAMTALDDAIDGFRNSAALEDDVTYFMFHLKGEAQDTSST